MPVNQNSYFNYSKYTSKNPTLHDHSFAGMQFLSFSSSKKPGLSIHSIQKQASLCMVVSALRVGLKINLSRTVF